MSEGPAITQSSYLESIAADISERVQKDVGKSVPWGMIIEFLMMMIQRRCIDNPEQAVDLANDPPKTRRAALRLYIDDAASRRGFRMRPKIRRSLSRNTISCCKERNDEEIKGACEEAFVALGQTY